MDMDMSGMASGAGGLIASAFIVAGYTMRTMIPLRVFGILTNVVLIVYGIHHNHYPIMALHAILLPLNVYRLREMLLLVRNVKRSVSGNLSMNWLRPFMTERRCKAGEVLFYKHEKAEEMFYIVSGKFHLVESGIQLPSGTIVGELGMLSPDNARTQTLECVEDGVVLSVSYRKVEELYVQNPEFGFYFLRLVSARLFQNVERLQNEVAELKARAAA
jgi:Cyclic nucleotide-binding domain